MKPLINTVALCLLVGVASLGAQQQQQQQQQEQQQPPKPPAEVSLTGCLTQGSMPSVFILENAKPANETITESGKRYLVVAQSKDVDLLSHVNNEVQLHGTVTGNMPPPEMPTPEKDLPQLQARMLSVVSNSCATR
jgi:hypothetical protein